MGGRSSSQRLKLSAVGLDHLPAFISEEWQSRKPHPARYEAIEARWPARRYATVADNPSKDFLTANLRGWLCLRAGWAPDPVHAVPRSNVCSGTDCRNSPDPSIWLEHPCEVLSWLS